MRSIMERSHNWCILTSVAVTVHFVMSKVSICYTFLMTHLSGKHSEVDTLVKYLPGHCNCLSTTGVLSQVKCVATHTVTLSLFSSYLSYICYHLTVTQQAIKFSAFKETET